MKSYSLYVHKITTKPLISVQIIKICAGLVESTFKIIFITAFKSGIYPDMWKKQMLFMFTKRKEKIC